MTQVVWANYAVFFLAFEALQMDSVVDIVSHIRQAVIMACVILVPMMEGYRFADRANVVFTS